MDGIPFWIQKINNSVDSIEFYAFPWLTLLTFSVHMLEVINMLFLASIPFKVLKQIWILILTYSERILNSWFILMWVDDLCKQWKATAAKSKCSLSKMESRGSATSQKQRLLCPSPLWIHEPLGGLPSNQRERESVLRSIMVSIEQSPLPLISCYASNFNRRL